MPLPVLRNAFAAGPADFVRLFHQSQLEWARHLGEETQLDFGRWISNPALPNCDQPNCLLDAFLLPGVAPTQVLSDMQTRCRQAGVPWRICSLNPSVPIEQSEPLADVLQSAGWKFAPLEILYRTKNSGERNAFPQPDLTVIPSRAGYRHYRQLMDEREPGTADVALMHLDDSHVDSLLALRDGIPVGCISVLTTGEVGTVREWYVAVHHRRQGIGAALLDRALEVCARGLLRHVMIGIPQEADSASRLSNRRSFQSIGKWIAYRKG